ncbi:MAG: antibiotic biosynthesis monooxygenase [Micromonosporaceae bacterium]|nr:antibiotic biosynthesis monooxygenase [Micromonosporaceae bacterium]
MLVVNRFVVAEADQDAFTARAAQALNALAARPGYLRGSLGRGYDDPQWWSLVTEWESVGAYRRALSAFEVRVGATPLLADALDEPSAYEELATAGPGGEVLLRGSDRSHGTGPLPSPP